MLLVITKERSMNAKKNNVTNNPVMMENLEDRQLYSVSLTPSIPIPPPSPTSSRIVVVQSATNPPPTTNVVISIIAVLIGL
jgi:hypothetical protein